MSGNRFDDFRLVLTAPDCPQLISEDAHSRSFLGFDPATERIVEYCVARRLTGQSTGVEDSGRRAQRERCEGRAQRWSQVCHSGVATALGWGQWQDSLVVVSEFVDGESLLEYGERVGALPPELSLSVVLQTAGIAALAAQHHWLEPLRLSDFAIDYDERDCLRVRLYNVGLFREASSAQPGVPSAGEAAARLWFRRLVVLLEKLLSGGVVADALEFDRMVDVTMPDDGSLAKVFDQLQVAELSLAVGADRSAIGGNAPVMKLLQILRKGVLSVSGVDESTAARCFACRPGDRWAPVGPLPSRIYGESDAEDYESGAGREGAFAPWLRNVGVHRWWQPPHRLHGGLGQRHLGMAAGTEVHVQLFPPACYAPGFDQNRLIASMQDSRLRGHPSLVKTYAANWDAELTYTLEEPINGFRLCDWAARPEDLPVAEVVDLMLALSRCLRQLEEAVDGTEVGGAASPKRERPQPKWPIDPWSVWVCFTDLDWLGSSPSAFADGSRLSKVATLGAHGDWPGHVLKIRLGPSWERMTLAASGVWSVLRKSFAEVATGIDGDDEVRDGVLDFATLTLWLAQYETLAAGLRGAQPSEAGVTAVVRENPLFDWMRGWLPILAKDGYAGRQIVLHELRVRGDDLVARGQLPGEDCMAVSTLEQAS